MGGADAGMMDDGYGDEGDDASHENDGDTAQMFEAFA